MFDSIPSFLSKLSYNQEVADEFERLLKEKGIEYTVKGLHGGYQWKFPSFPQGDVVLHGFSYGNDTCVESYGFPWDDGDVTALPPAEMVEKILEVSKNV